MGNKKTKIFIALIVVSVMILSSCGKEPTESIVFSADDKICMQYD